MNSMKRENDRILKEELPRSVGAQYATGDQWRNNSRKNEQMEPKQKQYPAVDMTGDRSKVQCCKEQYCIGTWNVRSMRNAVLGCNLKNDRMISVRFQGKPFTLTVIQVYAPTSNAEEAEIEWFYEDLQDLLELTPKKDVLFIIGDWNAKVGSQETPGITGKFGLGVQNEAGQRLIGFCQENALVKANTLFQQHK